MASKAELGRLVAYTDWANHRLVRAAATLNAEEFSRNLGASFGGVRGSLVHILGVEWLWLERLKGVSPTRLPDEIELTDIVAIRERWRSVETHRRAWLDALRDGDLERRVPYTTIAGQTYSETLWHIVQHTANHSSYHRGQVTLLLRLLGARVVDTDMTTWDRSRGDEPD